ncbi:MAG: sodium:proton antiporter [Cyanobacteriota bacterium]|nr:sodium:proton antiporter [Cyanobacteriota bacterium]
MENSFGLLLLITVALVAGIAAQVIANFFKVPGIVFLLPLGILVGPDGLGLVHPQSLGIGLDVLVSLAVALILFEGGLNLRWQQLSQVSQSLRNLVTVGTALTLLGGSIAAHYLAEFPWSLAFLYGSLVVVTGPTVINPILKRVRLDEAVSTLLEGEGVLIDPIGAVLGVVVLQVILSGNPNLVMAAEQLGGRLLIGATIGAVGGWLMGSFLLWSRQYLTEELRNSVVLAGALAVFALAQSLLSESGLMAVVVAGLVVRQKAAIAERSVRQFHGQLVVLAISVLFILLTASLSIKAVLALGWGAVATVGVLMVGVRPLSVWLCTWQSDLNWRQKLFISWLAPRGIVAASVASLFGILLTERGITGGDALKALVFLTIAMTVMIQGLTATWAARWLRLDQGRHTVIVGNHPLAQQLAELLRQHQQSVHLVSLENRDPLGAEGRLGSLYFQPASPPENHPQPDLLAKATDNATDKSDKSIDLTAAQSLFSESGLQANLEDVDDLVIMTLNPQLNWAFAELTVKLFASTTIWACLLPDMPISEGIRPLAPSFQQLQTWANYLGQDRTQLRSITLPALADLGFGRINPPRQRGLSTPVELGDITLNRLRDHFARRMTSQLCLPLVLVRPHASNRWLRTRAGQKVYLLPDPSLWHRGDQVFFLERSQTNLDAEPQEEASLPIGIPRYSEIKLHFDL